MSPKSSVQVYYTQNTLCPIHIIYFQNKIFVFTLLGVSICFFKKSIAWYQRKIVLVTVITPIIKGHVIHVI